MFDDKEFGKQFTSTRRFAIAYIVITGAVSFGVLVFAGWVIIRLMEWGGII